METSLPRFVSRYVSLPPLPRIRISGPHGGNLDPEIEYVADAAGREPHKSVSKELYPNSSRDSFQFQTGRFRHAEVLDRIGSIPRFVDEISSKIVALILIDPFLG